MARGPMKRYVRPLAQPDMLKMLLPRTPSLLKGRARRQSTWHMRPSGSLVQCHASTEPAQYESPLYLRKTLEAVCPVELFKVAGVTFEGRQARARCGEGAKQTPTPDPHHCLFIGLPLGLPKVITCYRTWRPDRLSLFSPPSRFFLPDPLSMVPSPPSTIRRGPASDTGPCQMLRAAGCRQVPVRPPGCHAVETAMECELWECREVWGVR